MSSMQSDRVKMVSCIILLVSGFSKKVKDKHQRKDEKVMRKRVIETMHFINSI